MDYEITFYRKKVAFRFLGKKKDGNVYCGVECANVLESTLNNENPNYDWKNKVYFSLSFSEISSILGLLGGSGEYSFFHNSSSGTKTFKIKKMDNGNLIFNIDFTSIDKNSSIKISPCSIPSSDLAGLKVMLEEFIKLLITKGA